ncbi:hypothetical protein [Microbulbifer agarilyticus]|uniref:hypothetical protein n=1 Tax=Microbulbifer agarilyticus TaxID=260552 RepID=UPI001CD67D3A|nr:hypothetical protein [Microbulbifer agarilyticus]MCA0901891.1 hypothetical protein [Microbulbifer agarilyticus]
MGFKLDHWDYLNVLVIIGACLCILVILLWIAGLPGRIAIARKHPDAEPVRIMGYAGFLAVVPWINAFIWASSAPIPLISAVWLTFFKFKWMKFNIARGIVSLSVGLHLLLIF